MASLGRLLLGVCLIGFVCGYDLPLRISIVVDDQFTMYADGEQLGSGTRWNQAVQLNAKKGVEVISVIATNTGGPMGMLFSFSNGYVSSEETKCISVQNADAFKGQNPNWNKANFDDNNWPNAQSFAGHGQGVWGRRVAGLNTINSNARWIWGPQNTRFAACRIRVGGQGQGGSGGSGDSVSINIAVDNNFKAYADGREIGTGNSWQNTYQFNAGSNVAVIGIAAANTGGPMGIIFSLSNGYVSSEETKCLNVANIAAFTQQNPNWSTASFNDAGWQGARVFAEHGRGVWGRRVANIDKIDSNARWIWGKQNSWYTLCRVRVDNGEDNDDNPAADGLRFNLVADNEFKAFADGQEVASETQWTKTAAFNVDTDTKVLAIEARNTGGPAGLVFSSNNGIVSSSEVRCVGAKDFATLASRYPNWKLPTFDDSQWPKSKVLGKMGMRPWVLRSVGSDKIAKNADWIWNENNLFFAYCRLRLASVQATIRSNQELLVYVDGELREQGTNEEASFRIELGKDPDVLAIYANNNAGGLAGILLSTDAYITSGAFWKCICINDPFEQTTVYKDWNKATFDDFSWPRAKVIEQNGGDLFGRVEDVDENAKWMWAADGGKDILCRFRLKPMTLKYRVDDIAGVFVDGKYVSNSRSWRDVTEVALSPQSQVIAIRAVNTGGPGGVLASLSNGVETDVTWKCVGVPPGKVHNELYPRWPRIDYNDASWPSAAIVEPNGGNTWKTESRIDANAKWIWFNNFGVREALCRGYIRPLELRVRALGAAKVFADGIFSQSPGCPTETPDDGKVRNINFLRSTKVLAIHVTRKEGPAALIASINNGLHSNNAWICKELATADQNPDQAFPDWRLETYDDSSWGPAIRLDTPRDAGATPAVDARASWISAKGLPSAFICRVYLAPRTFTFRVDDRSTLYVDGGQVSQSNNWRHVVSVPVKREAKVAVILGVNTGGPGGIVGSFDRGIVTDSSWRCIGIDNKNPDTDFPGYRNADFDDSNWPFARVVTTNLNARPWGNTPAIKPNANWIWSQDNSRSVLCRKSLVPAPDVKSEAEAAEAQAQAALAATALQEKEAAAKAAQLAAEKAKEEAAKANAAAEENTDDKDLSSVAKEAAEKARDAEVDAEAKKKAAEFAKQIKEKAQEAAEEALGANIADADEDNDNENGKEVDNAENAEEAKAEEAAEAEDAAKAAEARAEQAEEGAEAAEQAAEAAADAVDEAADEDQAAAQEEADNAEEEAEQAEMEAEAAEDAADAAKDKAEEDEDDLEKAEEAVQKAKEENEAKENGEIRAAEEKAESDGAEAEEAAAKAALAKQNEDAAKEELKKTSESAEALQTLIEKTSASLQEAQTNAENAEGEEKTAAEDEVTKLKEILENLKAQLEDILAKKEVAEKTEKAVKEESRQAQAKAEEENEKAKAEQADVADEIAENAQQELVAAADEAAEVANAANLALVKSAEAADQIARAGNTNEEEANEIAQKINDNAAKLEALAKAKAAEEAAAQAIAQEAAAAKEKADADAAAADAELKKKAADEAIAEFKELEEKRKQTQNEEEKAEQLVNELIEQVKADIPEAEDETAEGDEGEDGEAAEGEAAEGDEGEAAEGEEAEGEGEAAEGEEAEGEGEAAEGEAAEGEEAEAAEGEGGEAAEGEEGEGAEAGETLEGEGTKLDEASKELAALEGQDLSAEDQAKLAVAKEALAEAKKLQEAADEAQNELNEAAEEVEAQVEAKVEAEEKAKENEAAAGEETDGELAKLDEAEQLAEEAEQEQQQEQQDQEAVAAQRVVLGQDDLAADSGEKQTCVKQRRKYARVGPPVNPPDLDESTCRFARKQCNDDNCWCVNPKNGKMRFRKIKIPLNQDDFDCSEKPRGCLKNKFHMMINKPTEFIKTCRPDNQRFYQPMQCEGGECYCVKKKRGKERKRIKRVALTDKDSLKCPN